MAYRRAPEFLITSLSLKQVVSDQLARLWHWHCTIENVTHYPSDIGFGEDRCQVPSAEASQALAAFRNAVAATLHIKDWPYLRNGFRHYRTNLQEYLQVLGATEI